MTDGTDSRPTAGRALPSGAPVGIVGPADETDPVADAVAAAGATPRVGTEPDDVAGADVFLALGDSAAAAVARRAPSAPILAVGAGPGFQSIPRDAVGAAVDHLLDGAWEPRVHPVVSLSSDDDPVRAAMDAMLVTSTPARISEYTVRSGDEHVATVRADGVAVALPVGSSGYARAADGPVVAPGTGVASVVPVAPFATDPDHWVLPVEGLSVTVEREEAAVDLLADDRTVGPVTPHEPVTLAQVDTFRTAVVPESRPFFPTEE